MLLSAEIGFQKFAAAGCPQFIDGFVFDLAHPFAGKAKFVSNVFQRHRVFNANTKV